MLFDSAALTDFDLKTAIDPHPLTTSPDTVVEDVIAQMYGGEGVHNTQQTSNHPCDSSCVLVVEKSTVVGIFTERDIVRLSAAKTPFADKKIAEVMIQQIKTLQTTDLNDVFAVLFLFRRYHIRHLPILDSQNRLVGLISQTSLRSVLKPVNLLKLRRVEEAMTSGVITAEPQASLLEIAQLMYSHRVSCIVIVQPKIDERVEPVGIITERDLVKYHYQRLELLQHQAQDVMSAPLILLAPEDSLWRAYQQMKSNGIRRLVVSWNWGKNLSLITQTSLLKMFDPIEMYAIIETLQQTVADLEAKNRALEQS